MAKIIVSGRQTLIGSVNISGSKNAALPILAACLLIPGENVISNLPKLLDIKTMLEVLKCLGAGIKAENGRAWIDASGISHYDAPYKLVRQMRASVLVMGPLLARFGKAIVPLPGGCAIGLRPIDIHLKALELLGAKIIMHDGCVEATASRLKGQRIYFDFPSVGATENIMMAACLAEGQTIIHDAALEPEIVDLANFLNKAGASISGAGTSKIEINGVERLNPVEYNVIPDRIEAGTYMVAAAITKGNVLIKGCIPSHLDAVITKLREAEVTITEEPDGVRVEMSKELASLSIKTMPYPGFPTDMQAQFMALMATTPGISIIVESVFENRFMHVSELCRMGADIKVDGHTALIRGVPSLSGAPVVATDLRASVALILAGLIAGGKTKVTEIHYLDRGYEYIEDKLSSLGAIIKRVE
ncbi:UDP-N-acetylglucosamine 1-carboxyvinyltransferase [bacterium]|nr:UDP-N-acetylglucosamine 1-carboxyvinyltransferase [bacterium]MBU1753097.1 UDP-N-acetylglucosamine 1-carboxyvinyltransferase [bacterium]